MIGAPPRAFAAVVKVVLTLAYLLPLLWIVLTAFKSNAQILAGPNSFVFHPSLDAFRQVFLDGTSGILTSLKVALLVTAVVIVVAVPTAFALTRGPGRVWGRVVAGVLGVLLVLQMVPQPMTVIPLYGVLAKWRVANLTGLVLADVALFVPFAVLLLRPFALSIPAALFEAAELDGASQFQTFRHLVVPLLVNGVATVSTIVFIGAWGEFIYAINLLPSGSALPISGVLAQQISQYSVSWNTIMALALLTALPLLLVFAVAQRRLVSGLSVGAVK